MTRIVKIELHFEKNNIADEDVYQYLSQLMDNGILHWTIDGDDKE
ncbi:MAG: hypothetical protein VB817_00555 [Pirellulaceae bacterium]